jgi:hypothetical protein
MNRVWILIASATAILICMVVLFWITGWHLWALLAGAGALITAVGTIVGLVTGIDTFVKRVREWHTHTNALDIKYQFQPMGEGVVEHFDPSKDSNHYNQEEGSIINGLSYVVIDVKSQVNDETIKLAPYLLLALTSVEPIPEAVDYIVPVRGGRGGNNKLTISCSWQRSHRSERQCSVPLSTNRKGTNTSS